MSIEENKAVVRRLYEEVITGGNSAALDEIAATDIHDYGMVQAGYPVGLATFHQHIALFRTAFPDIVATVDALIGDGDHVVAIWTATGTHRTTWFGIEPTGKRVTATNSSVLRLRGGKIVEYRVFTDRLSFLEQVGATVVAPRSMEAGS
ncbi:MAG TPA: ester cyclase [Herpetosiphonaceae bacterium]|nr:ester cyclase [Herpetosiphonaceae bacterium]